MRSFLPPLGAPDQCTMVIRSYYGYKFAKLIPQLLEQGLPILVLSFFRMCYPFDLHVHI